MPYIYSRPSSPAFAHEGFMGYTFGPLGQDLDFYYIESEKGHDFFMISKAITRIYYIISGTGYFTIDSKRYDVQPGMLVEVPPKIEYCYSGKMTLICFSTPRWFKGNEKITKWNPDVVGDKHPPTEDRSGWLRRLLGWRVFGQCRPIRSSGLAD